MGLLDTVRSAARSTRQMVDPAPGPEATIANEALREIVAQAQRSGWTWDVKQLRALSAFQRALDLSAEEHVEMILEAMREAARRDGDRDWQHQRRLNSVAGELLRRKLPWDERTLLELTQALNQAGTRSRWGGLQAGGWGPPVRGVLTAVEKTLERKPPSPALSEQLAQTRELLSQDAGADDRKAIRRLDSITGLADERLLPTESDPWAKALLQVCHQQPGPAAEQARSILKLAADATSSKPTKDFIRRRDALIAGADPEQAAEIVGELLERCARAVPISRAEHQLPPETGDVVRGICWIAGALDLPPSARGLGTWAHTGWQKVPGHGPLSRKAASAALTQLADLPQHGAAQLGRVRSQLKQRSAVAEVDRAIDRAAERIGIDRAEFEERVVPHFDLCDGVRQVSLGDHVVHVHLGGDLKAALRFTGTSGKPVKSAPAALRRDFAEELKRLKAEAKDISVMAGAQRLRLERLLMDQRVWPLETWKRRYLDHGLVGVIARRLIWTFTGDEQNFTAIWHDGRLVGLDGEPVDPGDHWQVGLWHPVDADADQVHAWRRFLEERQVTQPLKQAHREVYLLTDAERATAVYSNRFAAHVLRQHQFAALARGRGWSYALQGAFDAPDEQAELALSAYELTASFWVERPWDTEDWNDAGIYNHVLTDQVRFVGPDGQAVALSSVPVRVLSEVLRDVDLFVGVASIGNDPAWQDGGVDQRYDRYWSEYSFGDLGEAAKVRRDVLERLLPKLKIADVTRLEDRFLVVDGQIRTYRIHLGSGNIRMDPNDQYLCIVPGRSEANSNVFLPFEGDRVLSIILSKAMMLAKDTEITDSTIISQIGRARR